MAQRIGGSKRKCRHKLSKHFKKRGKISITRYLQAFKEGDKAVIYAEPSIHKGFCDPKFCGRIVEVIGKAGSNYEVKIYDGGKRKTLIVHPVHLMRLKNG